jgi:hypothetical protein
VTDLADSSDSPRYFGNVLSSFENGLQLDLAFKLAVDFIKSGVVLGPDREPASEAAYALSLGEELVAIARERGLVKELPDDDELNAPLRRHLRRQVRAQLYQQLEGQRLMAEEQAHRIVPGVAMPVGNGRQ